MVSLVPLLFNTVVRFGWLRKSFLLSMKHDESSRVKFHPVILLLEGLTFFDKKKENLVHFSGKKRKLNLSEKSLFFLRMREISFSYLSSSSNLKFSIYLSLRF